MVSTKGKKSISQPDHIDLVSTHTDSASYEIAQETTDGQRAVEDDDDAAAHGQVAEGSASGQEGQHVTVEDDDIDPALREIVNSLTNAQQVSQPTCAVIDPSKSSQPTSNFTQAQAAAAIGAHLAANEERERLQQSLQSTLDDLAQSTFGTLFPNNYPHSPSYLLAQHPDPSADATLSPDNEAEGVTPLTTDDPSSPRSNLDQPLKRGRGRPKGSKNKPKPDAPPKRPTKRTKPPPSRPRGRPRKVRDPEEQAELDRKGEEKALGIHRRRGRPRKYPGYLVREMRLKKNRSEFNDLLRRHETEGMEYDQEPLESDPLPEGHGHDHMYPDWPQEDATLLDAVDDLHQGIRKIDAENMNVEAHVQAHTQMHAHGDDMDTGEPSGLGKSDPGMIEVFGLDQ